MRNVHVRTAGLCLAFALLGKLPACAQEVAATPQEEERALEALRAGLGDQADQPGPFDPHSAKTWDAPPASDIAPGLYANLFQPATEILSVETDGDWLPGPLPQQDSAATAPAPAPAPPEQLPPKTATTPEPRKKPSAQRTAQKAHSVLRSGRASLTEKSTPKPRQKIERSAPKAPAIALPGELRP